MSKMVCHARRGDRTRPLAGGKGADAKLCAECRTLRRESKLNKQRARFDRMRWQSVLFFWSSGVVSSQTASYHDRLSLHPPTLR